MSRISLEASEAAKLLRAIPSEARTQASRENGKLGGRPRKLLHQIPYTCGGSGLEHKTGCPRGRALHYRRVHNLPLDLPLEWP